MNDTQTSAADKYRARIQAAIDVLDGPNGETKTLAVLANSAAMSPFHFHRIFRALTGETVGGVTRRFRLARAIRLLRQDDQSITAIALEVGFESSQNLAKSLKALTDTTPTQARQDDVLAAALLQRLAKPRFIIMKEYKMSDVKIVKVKPFKTIGIRHIGPYQEIGPVYEKLMNWVAENKLFWKLEGFYGVGYDDPNEVAPQEIRADACIRLRGDVEPGPGMKIVELGGGEYARLLHKGPYENLRESYDALYGRWLPASGREPADKPPFEKYLNDATKTKPEKLKTEIYLPLK